MVFTHVIEEQDILFHRLIVGDIQTLGIGVLQYALLHIQLVFFARTRRACDMMPRQVGR